jgi:iron complex transport system permease protein
MSSTVAHRPTAPARAGRGFATPIIAAGIGLIALAGLSLAIGAFPVPLDALLTLLWQKATGAEPTTAPAIGTIVFDIRGPRVLAAMLVGAALSASGASYQGLFRNPLVSPDILGVASGAALGAVLGIYFSLPVPAIELLGFLGGLGAVAAVYGIAATIRNRDPVLVLVLGGVVIGSLLGSGVALLKYLADPYNQLPAITFWLLGSLSAVTRSDLGALAVPVMVALLPLFLLRWRLDVMSLGDEEAKALGVSVTSLRIAVIAAATLMTSASVAIAGIVGWVGLLVPHLARLIVGPAFIRLLPMSLLLGAVYLLAVDTAARTIATAELPLGVLTALFGTPVFLWLLAFGKRPGWS